MFYLATAFIVFWAAVTGYVVYLSSRQRHLENELQTLEELLEEQKPRG